MTNLDELFTEQLPIVARELVMLDGGGTKPKVRVSAER